MIFLGYMQSIPSGPFVTIEHCKYERKIAQVIFGLTNEQSSHPKLLFKEVGFPLSLLNHYIPLLELYLDID